MVETLPEAPASKKANKGIPFVSALQLYLDLRVLCPTGDEEGLELIRGLRSETFPAYYLAATAEGLPTLNQS